MFVVKFRHSYKEGDETWTTVDTVIGCDHYQVLRRANGSFTITTYPSQFDKEGVERQIYKDTGFDGFFIENASGKTIDSGFYNKIETK